MSLLAWYPLIKNGNNQGLDGTNLTTTGTVTYTAGKIGNAATFTGSTANRLTRSLFTETSNLSFAAWIKPTTHTSTGYFFTNGRADAASDGWGIGSMTNGTIKYCFGSYTSYYSDVITDGTWHHVAMTVDSNKLAKCYLDGVQVASATVATLPDYSEAQLFCIGAFQYNNGYIYPVTGQVQDFRYYNHVLSAKEVKELSKGLCVHYQLKGAGAGANLLYNSQTIFNHATWGHNSNGCSITRVVEDDELAVTGKRLKITIVNSATSAKGSTGVYIRTQQFGMPYYDNNLRGPLEAGKKYTYSFYAKADVSNTSNIGLAAGSICEGRTINGYTGFGNLTTSWRKHTVTCTYTTTGGMTTCFYVTAPASSTVIFYIAAPKMEEGSIATPWIPHVYDSSYTSLGYGRKVLPYTIVGSPTNNTGFFSNFSSANYINTGVTFAPGTNKWEVTTKVVTGTDITTVQYFQGCLPTSGSWGFLLGLSNSKIHLFLSSNGTSWDISGPLWGLAVVASTSYWFKYGYDGTQYYIKRSTDNGATYTTDVTLTSSTGIHSGAIYIGSAWDKSYPFKGNIDMEKFTITYKNNTWYSGSTSRVNAIEPDCTGYGNNGTVNGRISTTNSSPRYLSCESFTNTTITSTTGFPLSSTIPAFTINFWYKPNESVTYTAWADLVAFTINSTGTSTGATSFRLEVQDTSGGSWRWFYNNYGQSSYGFGYTTAITSSAWSMITLTVDASKNYKCYLNGTQYASGTLDSGFVPAGTTGALRVCDGGGMYGSYSDYRVYATALSADDVKELYQTSASIDKLGNTYSYEFVEE